LKVGEISQIEYREQEEALKKDLDESYIEITPIERWFRRNPDRSFLFGIFVIRLFAVALMALMGFLLGLGEEYTGLLGVINFAILIPVTLWYLKQKGRAASNLFYLFIPFGWIIILRLKNWRLKGKNSSKREGK